MLFRSLTGLGALLGLAGSLALTRLLGSQLYGVKPTDALTLSGVTALLLLVSIAACFIPARRATRRDEAGGTPLRSNGAGRNPSCP